MSFDEVKEYYAVYRSYFYTLVVLVVCVAVAFVVIEKRAGRLEAESFWPRAIAKIIESKIEVHGHVGKNNPRHGITARIDMHLHYQVDGHEITTYLTEIVSGPLSWKPEQVFATGSVVTVRYNPDEVEVVRLYHPGLAR